MHGKLALIDLRGEDTIFADNRFMVHAPFPQRDVSAHVMSGLKRQNTDFAVGKSILDRGSPIDVGAVCFGYGGGGRRAAGTCQVANERAEIVKVEMVALLNAVPVTLIRSRKPSRSSKPCCDALRNVASRVYVAPSRASYASSPHRNAQTSSLPLGTSRIKLKTL